MDYFRRAVDDIDGDGRADRRRAVQDREGLRALVDDTGRASQGGGEGNRLVGLKVAEMLDAARGRGRLVHGQFVSSYRWSEEVGGPIVNGLEW